MRTTPICIALAAGLGAALASAIAEPLKAPLIDVATGWIGVQLPDEDIGSRPIEGQAPRLSSVTSRFARRIKSNCEGQQSARLFGDRLTLTAADFCGSLAARPLKLAAPTLPANLNTEVQ
jgi:hypothetical protein